jgi:hypothetical protein
MPTVPGVSRSVNGVPAFIDPRAGRAELAPQLNGARSKPRYPGILQIPSLARDLAASHGYTVLQAIQEWYRSKGSSNGLPLGEVSGQIEPIGGIHRQA